MACEICLFLRVENYKGGSNEMMLTGVVMGEVHGTKLNNSKQIINSTAQCLTLNGN